MSTLPTVFSPFQKHLTFSGVCLILGVVGCNSSASEDGIVDDDDGVCSTEARASVSISVVDESGASFTPEGVVFSVDGGEERVADCVDAHCTQWVAGWEETGEFLVTALGAYGETSANAVVELTDDGCHVVGQVMTLELESSAPCTDLEAPSVVVDIVDTMGEPLTPTSVEYSVDGGALVSAECGNTDCTAWFVGAEQVGEFDITAVYSEMVDAYCGYYDVATSSATVGEMEDGCHVDTQSVTMTLDASLLMCE